MCSSFAHEFELNRERPYRSWVVHTRIKRLACSTEERYGCLTFNGREIRAPVLSDEARNSCVHQLLDYAIARDSWAMRWIHAPTDNNPARVWYRQLIRRANAERQLFVFFILALRDKPKPRPTHLEASCLHMAGERPWSYEQRISLSSDWITAPTSTFRCQEIHDNNPQRSRTWLLGRSARIL
jgi:hypothetical protein